MKQVLVVDPGFKDDSPAHCSHSAQQPVRLSICLSQNLEPGNPAVGYISQENFMQAHSLCARGCPLGTVHGAGSWGLPRCPKWGTEEKPWVSAMEYNLELERANSVNT